MTKQLALLWTANGRPMVLIDSSDPHGLRLEAKLQMLQTHFPEAGARMAFVEVTECTRATAETLRPAADPFAPEALELAGRQAMETLPDTLVERDRRENAGILAGRKP